MSKIVPYLIAHKQVASRAAVVMKLLRELEFLPLRYRTHTQTHIVRYTYTLAPSNTHTHVYIHTTVSHEAHYLQI